VCGSVPAVSAGCSDFSLRRNIAKIIGEEVTLSKFDDAEFDGAEGTVDAAPAKEPAGG